MIDIYIEARRDDPEVFDLDDYAFASDITDETVIRRFRETHEASSEMRTLREVVEDISQRRDWGANDERTLAEASVDEYYTLFKESHGKNLSRIVHACLQFGRFQNATEQQRRIGASAVAALRRIASESPINQRRVLKYGVRLEEEPDASQ